VAYARIAEIGFPVRSVGMFLFVSFAAWALWHARHVSGPRVAALLGAQLVFAYSILAVGVHDNHPHPFFLILLTTGLPTRSVRALFVITSTTYVLNSALLSGLGRFYGARHAWIAPLSDSVTHWRMVAGFDLTLPLVILNVACVWGLCSEPLAAYAPPETRPTE
jgi:hypothetical protein